MQQRQIQYGSFTESLESIPLQFSR